jgi:hypothetical protein
MATQNLVQRKMQITLNSAAPAADRQGNPQWELRCADPFSMNSSYEAKFWIPANEGEQPPPPATYWCILTQGALKINTKPPKEGGPIQPYNGFYDWMWRWRIDSRDHFHCPDAPEPPQTQNIVQPTPPMGIPVGATAVNGVGTPYTPPAHPTTSERQTVLKGAVDATVATDLVDQSPEVILGRIASIAGVPPEHAGDLWTILQHIGSEAPVAPESVEVEEFDEEPLPWA